MIGAVFPMMMSRPDAQGLYHPDQEHDACGVGFVVDIKGRKSHAIASDALTVLENMSHRGACGCDPETGDGAGILIQIPHHFLASEMQKQGVTLPQPGRYAVGMVFMGQSPTARRQAEQVLTAVSEEEGLELFAWRDVPVEPHKIGRDARSVMPFIRQFFIRRPEFLSNTLEFERRLFLVRKQAHNRVWNSDIPDRKSYYVCSLSSRTLIYKGMLTSDQVRSFYTDLRSPALTTAIALVHSRFSTNTFPSWELAHPYRMIAHNGEINTLRGNRNWMTARFGTLQSKVFGREVQKLHPLVNEEGSDSATFDNALEFLCMGGRSLPHSVMMMVPEAWTNDEAMPDWKRSFYEYHACLMEPWDGPAAICFTDGSVIGAVLDRNGLRPGRYWVTDDDRMIYASESGVLEVPTENILYKGKMKPGRMLLVDTSKGRIIDDEELKKSIATSQPYRQWLDEQIICLENLPNSTEEIPVENQATLLERQQAFGYSREDLDMLMAPMAATGEEAIGSMGTDTPLAVLSERPQLLYNYFKQLFAQVTNPPIDSIREDVVMSTWNYLGRTHNILGETPEHCHLVRTKHVLLSNEETARLRHLDVGGYRTQTVSTLFDASTGVEGFEKALERVFAEAEEAARSGKSLVILSDRGVSREKAALPALLVCAGLHHHLIRAGLRGCVGLIVETGEAREIHHFALLVGYGAGAINPYLAFETVRDMIDTNTIPVELLKAGPLSYKDAVKNYIKAVDKAILKVMAKMGISTVQSYQAAQIFEAIGLSEEFIAKYFTKTSSRIGGIGLSEVARETLERHGKAFPDDRTQRVQILDVGGQYQWRRGGEFHLFNPDSVFKLQHSCRTGDYKVFKEYAQLINDQSKRRATLRGLFRFKPSTPVPIDEVEPVSEIVRRFATGAMSLGSISTEAHETLAIAMNRIGGRSNTGEGGEDPRRFSPDPDGRWRNSAIKQVASARFGVTTHYLANARELQIKMAQGAKPGEGGQLPGHKVDKYIGWLRHATPGVPLISPPPHHDIYSIEDLAQLIHDLKNSNPRARISVKLVSEVGVGTIAAGVSKAKSDVVLISGHDGGTGASPLTSIKHAGAPWELGLAETHQVLMMNDLRSRIVVQCDGQLKTGRDVAIAILLGAEEFGCATAPLVAAGCIMMRKCHLNTCPVGIATQDPVLRAKFNGHPDHVVNFFFFMAQELREIMAELGFRSVSEMVGRSDLLDMQDAIEHYKSRGLDFSAIFYKPKVAATVGTCKSEEQDHGLDMALDRQVLIPKCEEALLRKQEVRLELPIKNINRTVGTMLSGEVARIHGAEGLPTGTIKVHFRGSAGQSFGAFLYKGIEFKLEGDANDYVGKGLSGGQIVLFPPSESRFLAEENIIVGNTCLYGATSGRMFVRGQAGERYAVRNSGAHTVIEGIGDHGCEYMTGGVAVVLGPTGRNFAAGMSGGLAFVLNEHGRFPSLVNRAMVDLDPVESAEHIQLLTGLLEDHAKLTGSAVATRILDDFEAWRSKFVLVFPKDYKRALRDLARSESAA
jgi:glutamate synthase domain-containing protein 2/glutamate synthase domain-containing protein 1/glutamate synthase domain-containing protein 3